MVKGRSARLQELYDLPMGASLVLNPEGADSLQSLFKKLQQVTKLYLRQGRAFRLEMQENGVKATRVAAGTHKKLGHLLDLAYGERHFVASDLEWHERKSLLAKLWRFSLKNKGFWEAEIDPDGIWIRRTSTGAPDEHAWPIGTGYPEPKWLTLARD